MQGPITVFEDGSYAGDAQIQDIQPKEERLLSYAIDLGMEVQPEAKTAPQRLVAVKIYKGILQSSVKVRESKIYKVINRTEHNRTLLIEHPYRPGFHLVSTINPVERTRDIYRFELKVPAGKNASLTVAEEADQLQQLMLTNSDDQTMRVFLQSKTVSKKVQEALQRALEMRSKLAATQRDLVQLRQQLKEIIDDQSRLRANVKDLPPNAPAYKRYLDKFDKQETQIENLQGQIKKLEATGRQELNDYENYLANLTVG